MGGAETSVFYSPTVFKAGRLTGNEIRLKACTSPKTAFGGSLLVLLGQMTKKWPLKKLFRREGCLLFLIYLKKLFVLAQKRPPKEKLHY